MVPTSPTALQQALHGYFSNQTLLVATQHGKERVMAPLLTAALGCEAVPPVELPTDELGTFSGEVARPADMLTTARMKAEMGCKKHEAALIAVTEGSFGPHPQLHFVPANTELVLLYEPATQRQWHSISLSTATNFASQEVSRWSDLQSFAAQVDFPNHALIVRPSAQAFHDMQKGITSWELLRTHAEMLLSKYGRLWVETDMRAHLNPTRMEVIAAATQKLIEKLQCLCPQCALPGYGLLKMLPGLPCAWCRTPSDLPKAAIYGCDFCGLQEQRKTEGPEFADPGSCLRCNP